MTDEQRAGLAPMSIDERIEWAREIIARKEDEAKTSDSFALALSLSSMRQHLAEMEAQVAERDAHE